MESKGLENKLIDWNKLTKLKSQIDTTANKDRKVDLIRIFSHQANLYKNKYNELYSPAIYPGEEIHL